MKIKSAKFFREKYMKDVRHIQPNSGYDPNFIGCGYSLEDGSYVKGFFDMYHGDKQDIGGFLSGNLSCEQGAYGMTATHNLSAAHSFLQFFAGTEAAAYEAVTQRVYKTWMADLQADGYNVWWIEGVRIAAIARSRSCSPEHK